LSEFDRERTPACKLKRGAAALAARVAVADGVRRASMGQQRFEAASRVGSREVLEAGECEGVEPLRLFEAYRSMARSPARMADSNAGAAVRFPFASDQW
jgi:hypothetical protein